MCWYFLRLFLTFSHFLPLTWILEILFILFHCCSILLLLLTPCSAFVPHLTNARHVLHNVPHTSATSRTIFVDSFLSLLDFVLLSSIDFVKFFSYFPLLFDSPARPWHLVPRLTHVRNVEDYFCTSYTRPARIEPLLRIMSVSSWLRLSFFLSLDFLLIFSNFPLLFDSICYTYSTLITRCYTFVHVWHVLDTLLHVLHTSCTSWTIFVDSFFVSSSPSSHLKNLFKLFHCCLHILDTLFHVRHVKGSLLHAMDKLLHAMDTLLHVLHTFATSWTSFADTFLVSDFVSVSSSHLISWNSFQTFHCCLILLHVLHTFFHVRYVDTFLVFLFASSSRACLHQVSHVLHTLFLSLTRHLHVLRLWTSLRHSRSRHYGYTRAQWQNV